MPQILAAEVYEEAATNWRILHGERLEKNDDATIFERAQIDWAHDEAVLKVQESVTVHLEAKNLRRKREERDERKR